MKAVLLFCCCFPLRGFCFSPVLVSSLLVPFLLVSFGKVWFVVLRFLCSRFPLYSLRFVFASIGFMIKVSASIANLIFISMSSILDIIIIYQS